MRTIKLELVRHGPPHNQLLSPFTPYLALCENHPPVTVHVPFEHNQFLYRLKDLYYQRDESAREFQLFEMGKTIGGLLGQIPGLIAEVSREECRKGSEGIQLRLILSSSELALLPFELALSSEGLPGSGLPLVLQSDVPICITREVRRSLHQTREESLEQPTKILFAWASPTGLAEVPYQAHLLALRESVNPWWGLSRNIFDGQEDIADDAPIKVLPQSTIQDIEVECIKAARANRPFTHVHILAHGLQNQVGFDIEYGLALHKDRQPDGEPDIVLGERLATALGARNNTLGATKNTLGGAADKPGVVTIASCYGGAQGSVAGAGASIAHALHVDGIPVVIATQFPLRNDASVRMVEVLYERLLWGEDPRLAIADLRRMLHVELRGSHDWAGITAYVELESEYETDLPYRRLDKIIGSMRLSLMYSDSINKLLKKKVIKLDKELEKIKEETSRLKTAELRLMELHNSHFSKGKVVDEKALPYWRQQAAHLYLWLGIANEIRAQYSEFKNNLKETRTSLVDARTNYWLSIVGNREEPWRAIKYLWLEALLGFEHAEAHPGQVYYECEQEPAEIWASVHAVAVYNLHHFDRLTALSQLFNLYLVSLAFPRVLMLREEDADAAANHAAEDALQYAKTYARDEPYGAETNSWELRRYVRQYKALRGIKEDDLLIKAATRVINELELGATTRN